MKKLFKYLFHRCRYHEQIIEVKRIRNCDTNELVMIEITYKCEICGKLRTE